MTEWGRQFGVCPEERETQAGFISMEWQARTQPCHPDPAKRGEGPRTGEAQSLAKGKRRMQL